MIYKTSDQTNNLRTVFTDRSYKTSTSSYNIDRLEKANEKCHFVQVAPMEVTPCKTANVPLIVEALRTKKT